MQSVLNTLTFILVLIFAGTLAFISYIIYNLITLKSKSRKKKEELNFFKKKYDIINNQKKISVDNTINYKSISSSELSIDNVINRYLTTEHDHCKSDYRLNEYLEAEFECILTNLQRINISLSDTKLFRRSASELPYEKSKNITTRYKIDSFKSFIALDVETTGINPSGNDIIEISAIKFIDFCPKKIYTTLLKPRKSIPKEATNVNGITDEMVASSPKLSQIHKSLIDFIKGYPLVMHNARFDLRFLYACGIELDYEKLQVFDTLELSRRIIKEYDNKPLENYKLKTVCNEVFICFKNQHRSSSDALATGLLFNEIIKKRRNIPDLTQFEYY